MLNLNRLRNLKLIVNLTSLDAALARRLEWDPQQYRGETCPVALAATRALRARFRRHPGIRARVKGRGIWVAEGPTPIGSLNTRGRINDVAFCELTPELLEAMKAFDGSSTGAVPTSRTTVNMGFILNGDR